MAKQRGQWSGKLGFILAAAGGAVGLGNLWKFPYITYENGGGAFVLIYLAAIVLVGAPVMIAEVLLGRRAQKDPVGTFTTLSQGKPGGRAWSGVGILGVITGFVILAYYCVVAGWTLRFIWMAISGELAGMASHPAELDTWFKTVFLPNGTQQVILHFIFMALTTGVVIFGVQNGIERAAKILVPILFAILVGLVIYSTTTDGFGEAVSFLFRPNFHELTRGSVLEALGHSFFTLSLGMGAMLTYGSYMRKTDSVPQAAITISVLDTVIAIMACLIMFSIIFSFNLDVSKMEADTLNASNIEVSTLDGSEMEGVTLDAYEMEGSTLVASEEEDRALDVSKMESSTILFTTLPTVFYKMPGGRFVAGIFYLLVAFAALTSTISLLEVVSSFAIDQLGWERRRATLTMGVSIWIFGVLSALSMGGSSSLSQFNLIGRDSTQGMFGLLDYLAANWFLPVGGFFIAIFAGWMLTRNESREELEEGHGVMESYGVWRFLIRFAAPLAIGAIIVSVLLGAEYQ